MRVIKLFVFLAVVVLSFLFSPVLGFLAQAYLYSWVGEVSHNMMLSGMVQFGTQLLVTIIISLPVYWLLWGGKKRDEFHP